MASGGQVPKVTNMSPRAQQHAIALTPEPTAFGRDFVYRIEILEDPPLVAVTTSGDATVSGWTHLHDGLRADPRVKGLPLLIDYSALDATFLSTGDVRLIGESVAALDRDLHPPRRAVVVTGGFEFGLTRMCHLQLDADLGARVRAFRSREDALAWLHLHQPDAPYRGEALPSLTDSSS
jgi:hypothetical protein